MTGESLSVSGQSWQHTRGSALLGLVGEDAAHLAEPTAHRSRWFHRRNDTPSRPTLAPSNAFVTRSSS